MSILTSMAAGRTRVRSSNLESVGYDFWTGLLEIEFKGGRIYQYFDVPLGHYIGLMRAESHGRFFAEYIRPVFEYRRVQ